MHTLRHLLAFASFICITAGQQLIAHNAGADGNRYRTDSIAMKEAEQWARKRMDKMSLEQRVGQLLYLRVPTQMNAKKQKEFEKVIRTHQPGGLCFFRGSTATQITQTKRFQHLSKVPMMITIDGEWGLGMRLTDGYSFPRQMMMGALTANNDTLIAQFGAEVGRQCRMMGIHVNFAPVADVNSNPLNPVIGCRSFGENPRRVARKASMYARAMQREGVMAVGKHFPGHGDTETDSHLGLPIISHSKAHIDSVDLYPFRRLVKEGIRGMMVGHLQINAYDDRMHMPSSLSERVVRQILRERMKFDGLVFTDGIDMKGVSKYYKDGESAVRAIRAGSDVILLPIDVEKTQRVLVAEAKRDTQFAKLIDQCCFRILCEKYLLNITSETATQISAPNRQSKERSAAITKAIADKALTLVKNDNYALPLEKDESYLSISLGNCDTALSELTDERLQQMRLAGKVVISLYGNLSPSNNYGISNESIDIINKIATEDSIKSVLVIYGSPYILDLFAKPLPTNQKTSTNTANAIRNTLNHYPPRPSAIVVAYQNIKEMHEVVEAHLKGERPFEGRLPVTAGNYPEGTSLKAMSRPAVVSPYARLEAAGMDEKHFRKIDSLVYDGIEKRAFPGCQLLVARNGVIVYDRCYGRQRYEENAPMVDSNTVYDIASLTKVTATLPAVMQLVDKKKIKLDDPLSRYVPYLKGSNKSKITIREVLSHNARLKSFDAYWKGGLDEQYLYRGSRPPEGYVAIGNKVYISESYRKEVLQQITRSDLNKKKGYVYSDLGFILLAELVQYVSGQSIDQYAAQHFFLPLKMNNTTYRPQTNGIALSRIAPTEEETTFRGQLIHGYVHDPNAAAMGGVAGHAGLFSTAHDLYRLYQMYLNKGMLDGKRYFSQETFDTFNRRHYAQKGNRRALGFDKPFISSPSTHVSPLASQSSFGHTGFTGTMVWVDPQYNLVYIFLSNRVHPSATPNKLASMNIRTNIQEEIYLSMGVEQK